MSRNQRILLFVIGLVMAVPILVQSFQGVVAPFQQAPAAAAELPKPGPMDALAVTTTRGVHRFTVEIAADDASRAEGLMYRTSMADDHGMLFDFKRDQPASFWMKNTYISLDMVFIRADGTVINIAEDTVPLSEASVSSTAPVRFVLELNAGTARRIGLKPGDKVVHQLMRPR